MDESILNRINTIKNVLEEDINNPIRILNEIKNVLIQDDDIDNILVKDILKKYYMKNPKEGINDEIINNLDLNDSYFNQITNNIEITENIEIDNILVPNYYQSNYEFNDFQNIELPNSLLSLSELNMSTVNTQSNSWSDIFLTNYIIENIENEFTDVPLVLKISELEKLKSCKFSELDNDVKESNNKCVISYDEFEENTDVLILPCNHIFNKEYCVRWLRNNSHKCPICRNSVGEYVAKIE